MRRLCLLIFAMFISWSATAEESVWQMLQRVSLFMNAEKGYEVKFSIEAEGFSSKGRYCVKDDSYYIEIAEAEVYSDGEVRYEVDKSRREVNIDVMNNESRNILDNPTRCFDFVEEEYTAEIVEQSGGDVTLKLRSTDEKVEGDILLTIEHSTGKPKSLEYMLYDDNILVRVENIEHKSDGVKSFSRSAYKDYEMIDFR